MGVNPKERLYGVGFVIGAEIKNETNTDKGFLSLQMLNLKGVRGERRGFPDFCSRFKRHFVVFAVFSNGQIQFGADFVCFCFCCFLLKSFIASVFVSVEPEFLFVQKVRDLSRVI